MLPAPAHQCMAACVCGLPPDGLPPLHPLPATHPLLTNNDPPAESETAQISDFLAGARKRRDGLDSNIATVAAILDTLVKERDLLAHDIRSHEGIISPLRQLPTEILCRIFVMARKPLANFELPKAPWYLGQISKRWREIALGMPVLWSSFWVYTAKGYIQPTRLLEQFQEQFRRAGDSPLDVTVRGGFSRLKGPLLDACGRWETLSTDAFDDLALIHGRAPMLRRVYSVGYCQRETTVYEFCVPCPDICELVEDWGSDSPLAGLTYGATSWYHLTRYDGLVTWEDYLDILRQAVHLVECRMYFCTNMTDTPLNDDILHLPNLRRFAVSTSHCLQYINTPGLEELALHGEYHHNGPPTGEAAHIVNFLRRTPCTLLRLTLHKIIPTLEVFQAAPSLSELTVLGRNTESMTTLVQILSPADHTPPVLPNLTAISLILGPAGDLPIGFVIQMIADRFNGAHGHKRLQFFGMIDTAKVARFPHSAPMKRVAEMQQEGLELCVVRGDKNYLAVLASDPYSVRRCTKYRNRHLTSNEIWEYV
ncbi:hypothetical protein C8R47DRAFT_1102176 [Mycena vitilis]|nr:hypothetical protein C8R47DRAFT_1102176 [Mycena vitilis]